LIPRGIPWGISLSPRYARYKGGTVNEIQRSYSEFLTSYPWRWFTTITYRKSRQDPFAASRDVCALLRSKACIQRGFVATEPHKSGLVHHHCLLQPYFTTSYTARTLQDSLNVIFGRSSCRLVNSQPDVSHYCSKYVTKQMAYYEFIGWNKAWNGL